MTRVDHQLRPPSMPEYIGSPDTTFAGSRNGFTPVVLWDAMSRLSEEDQARLAAAAQDRADRLEQGLLQVGTLIGRDLLVARSPLALTVRFLKPVDELVAKYSLSTEQFQSSPTEYAHVFVMHDVTDQRIDALLGDLAAPGAFPPAAAPGTADGAAPGTAAPTGVHVPLRGRGFH